MTVYADAGIAGASSIAVGSGTVVSADGKILTSAHVVNMAAHGAELDAWEAQAAAEAQNLDFDLIQDRVLILIPNASG